LIIGDPTEGEGDKVLQDISLVEIGPRFVLEIMRIFDGSFQGFLVFNSIGTMLY
jgi:hypothetical protein